MTLSKQIEQLEPMVLKPLHGVTGDEWHRAPDGKWSVAQIVQHLALGVDIVARAFDHRGEKAPMRRRATTVQSVARTAVLAVGRLPNGFQTPQAAQPTPKPDPELVTAQFRMGVACLQKLIDDWPEDRQRRVFVRHPRFGDLNLPEWVRFHFIHCRHHSEQLRERLNWIRQ